MSEKGREMTTELLEKEATKTVLRVDPLISFIVPVYKTNKDLLKRCIMSLIDQDYENTEIVVVFDGIDQELIKVTTPFLVKHKNFRIIEIEHKGACAARNAGFRASRGEIVSFFNSDYVAKPGMTRTWVDTLLDNPDYGFAYGGYEYASDGRNAYMAQPFNEFDLTQYNYIDCGFPLWRKHVVDWDENCKSLQDWDFWIRVVKNGVKGFYIERDPFYVALLPQPGGLSFDSHNNWVDRVKYVRDKNDIKTYPLITTSIGATNHAREIAKMIKSDYRDLSTVLKPNEYKALYLIGFYMNPKDQRNMHPDIMEHFKGKKRIVHFVGADIYWLRKFKHEDLKYIKGVLNQECDHILCETQLAKDELLEYGINSEIVPIPPYNDYEVKPLPDKFSVAIFLTQRSDFDKYCTEETLSIVRALPTVQFNAYGDGCKDVQYPNFKHFGNLDKEQWKKFVYENSCYLRLSRHDTRPLATDEFLMAGRDVVTNIPGDFVEYISTSGDPKKMEA
jgi:glycosyltransferase involved in cell wall biosynthesis